MEYESFAHIEEYKRWLRFFDGIEGYFFPAINILFKRKVVFHWQENSADD